MQTVKGKALALLAALMLFSAVAVAVQAHAGGTLLYVETRCLAYVSYTRWGKVNAYQNYWWSDGHVDYVSIWHPSCPAR